MIELKVVKLGIDVNSKMPVIILRKKKEKKDTHIVTLRYFLK